MAGTVTTTVNLFAAQWTQVAGSKEQVLVTPTAPETQILLRFAAIQPGAEIVTGHLFKKWGQTINAIVGSLNTDIAWMRSLNGDVDVEVTVL